MYNDIIKTKALEVDEMTNLSNLIRNDIIYVINPTDYQREELINLLKDHP